MSAKTITITITGEDDAAFEDALDEAVTRIKAGNTSGFDRNEESSFEFEVVETSIETKKVGSKGVIWHSSTATDQ